MPIEAPLALLGGLSPARFMQRHWQRKPLLVRGAVPGLRSLLDRAALFALAGQEGVESRLVEQQGRSWQLRQGPFTRRALPPVGRPRWTLLVQGVDLHVDAAHDLLQRFAFVPQARLDDLMISYATDGGGVGPHFDSYDVFLLQAQGRRRWRYGRQRDLSLRPDAPLKILSRFEPEHEHVLEPGDMLYLPPRYAHDGVAEGECQTYSIGFRSPSAGEIAREVLQRIADDAQDEVGDTLYRDPAQPAVARSGELPAGLSAFAQAALQRALQDPRNVERALGEYLSEPKDSVWFEAGAACSLAHGVALDRRTRMLYDARHVFINGESWRAAGADARLLRRLADQRRLDVREMASASNAARELIQAWCEAGWAREEER